MLSKSALLFRFNNCKTDLKLQMQNAFKICNLCLLRLIFAFKDEKSTRDVYSSGPCRTRWWPKLTDPNCNTQNPLQFASHSKSQRWLQLLECPDKWQKCIAFQWKSIIFQVDVVKIKTSKNYKKNIFFRQFFWTIKNISSIPQCEAIVFPLVLPPKSNFY